MIELQNYLEIDDTDIQKGLVKKVEEKNIFIKELIKNIMSFLTLRDIEKLYNSIYKRIKTIDSFFKEKTLTFSTYNDLISLIKNLEIKYIHTINFDFLLTRKNVLDISKINIKGNTIILSVKKFSMLELKELVNKFDNAEVNIYTELPNFCVLYNLVIEPRTNIIVTLYSNRLNLDDGITNDSSYR
jgi:glutaredoxin-related protein